MSLRSKLFEFQKLHIRVGKNAEAGKDSKWGYKYATLDKIWDVIQDHMDTIGIIESSSVKALDNGEYCVCSTLIDSADESDSICSMFPIDKELSPQDLWKAITYGRRYNLVALLNLKIVGEDDDAQWVGGRTSKAVNADKFVDTILKNQSADKAKTLFAKIESGEYSVSPAKLEALVSFMDNNG